MSGTVPRLRPERVSPAQCLAEAEAGQPPLGAIFLGTSAQPAWMPMVDARVLSPHGPMVDLWRSDAGSIRTGCTGLARWRTDGHWLFGFIALDEAAEGQGLAELSQRVYRALFDTLDAAGTPHLVRIWNYLPQINADGGGLERYRQFNLGRQQAFVDADRPAFEGAPAACALGIRQGALCVSFLAGQRPPLPIENPRQVSAYRYPSTYGPRAPTFSRAALADLGGAMALFISGTASIVGHETQHPGDVREQTRETMRNLAAVVDAANAQGNARFALESLEAVVYVRHAADVPAILAVIDETLGAGSYLARHAVVLEADICRSDLLVEIEGHAMALAAA
ncbi:MAG: hypothetical protein EOO26_01940 [Comamonadaceae bacterium]|nr:MAG: hypothetical protein EOO26_01940 [Comamonadaceae bacterium]